MPAPVTASYSTGAPSYISGQLVIMARLPHKPTQRLDEEIMTYAVRTSSECDIGPRRGYGTLSRVNSKMVARYSDVSL